MTARLQWNETDGFTLDLDALVDGVTVRFLGMTVPADGLERLREEPVALYALDLLFKSHIDLGEAPGQLHAATVQLVEGPALRVLAQIEDAETGQTSPWSHQFAVAIEGEPPDQGGVVPAEPDEDDLDWDDDTDLEGMIGAPASEASSPDGGLDGLLRSLLGEAPSAVGGAPSSDASSNAHHRVPDQAEASDDASGGGGVDAGLLAALLGEDPGDADEDARLAADFLRILIGREELELVEGADLTSLAAGAASLLLSEIPPGEKSRQLSSWLLDQAEVEELYIGDEELESLLDKW